MKTSSGLPDAPRFEFIDALRGFAIVLVVLGHALQYTLAAPDDDPLYRLIYSFHMPLFMFISGFVFSGAKRSASAELRLKSRSLLVPFLAWLPVTFVWMQLGPAPLSLQAFVVQVIASPDAGGLWFLWVLFLINLVMIAARALIRTRPQLGAWCLWAILNLIVLARPHSDLLGIKLLCWHLPFFLVGLAFRETNGTRPLRPTIILICIAAYSLLFLSWTRVSGGSSAPLSGGLHGVLAVLELRLFNYATAFLAIFAVFGIFSKAATTLLAKMSLPGIGRISLEIYVTHIYFIAVAVSAIAALAWPTALRVSLVFAVGLTGALAATWAIRRLPPLAAVMFGVRSRERAGPVQAKA
jgi:fucose 4-O-acetylase-like acetyltransferase